MCSLKNASFQCANGGQCVLNGTCICKSECYIGEFCQINYNIARLPLTGAIIQDDTYTRNIYIVTFVLFGLVGIMNNILALITFIREHIRITVYGIYFIALCLFGIVLAATLLSYVITIVQYDNDLYRRAACHLIPFVSLIMTDGGFLLTAAIAIERVLIECFNYSIHGSRSRGLFITLLITFYVTATNLDEIFIRRITNDIDGKHICIYDFDRYPTWSQIDVVFSYLHVLIPLALHVICSICVFTTIARRKIFIHNFEHGFLREWLKQFHIHKDFFIPPACLIVCLLPHGIMGHLLHACIPYSNKSKLRLHISFVLLLFVPQMLTFILYVYPHKIYWEEFKKTIIYRKIFYCFYQNERKSKQKQYQLVYQMKNAASVATICITVDNIGECK